MPTFRSQKPGRRIDALHGVGARRQDLTMERIKLTLVDDYVLREPDRQNPPWPLPPRHQRRGHWPSVGIAKLAIPPLNFMSG